MPLPIAAGVWFLLRKAATYGLSVGVTWLVYKLGTKAANSEWLWEKIGWTLEWAQLPGIPPEWTSIGCAVNAWIPIAEAWVCVKIYLSLQGAIIVYRAAEAIGAKLKGAATSGG